MSIAERFWSMVVKGSDDDACWAWTGSTCNGYGSFHLGGPHRAHRVSWELHHGPIPPGLWVLHHCDNPPCTNHRHLWLGTHADNVADKVNKGRQARHARGGRHLVAERHRAALIRQAEARYHATKRVFYGVSPLPAWYVIS